MRQIESDINSEIISQGAQFSGVVNRSYDLPECKERIRKLCGNNLGRSSCRLL
ncbi:hypothetical protein [Vibrio caribbeanicus]|uniref:hypothetical protein n=1 Tax=Vibrio caribbeanicus TaxID=701175 RepID=UPI0030DD2C8B